MEHPASALDRLADWGLQPPLSVSRVGMLRDGGSVTAGLADAFGCQIGIHFDNRIHTSTPGRLFVAGKIVPLGSPLEQDVIAVLQVHLDCEYSPAEQAMLLGITPGSDAFRSLSPEQVAACRLLTRLGTLRKIQARRQDQDTGRPSL